MQFTGFPNSGTTSSTRHGQYLFRGEFFGLHKQIMQRLLAATMFNIAHSDYIWISRSILGCTAGSPIVSKSEHLWEFQF
jgi:hypothetical protein